MNQWAWARKMLTHCALSVACLLGMANHATGALLAAGDARFNWTTDTATGLDWLDFDGGAAPSTIRRPRDEVAAELGEGGDYDGWRFATHADVYRFVLNATGFPFLVAAPNTSTVNSGATDLVAAWTGYTGQRGQPDSVSTIHGYTVVGYAGLLERDPTIYEDTTVWILYGGALNTNEPYDEMGSWLIRGETQVISPPVPEPGTLALTLVGVAVLGAVSLAKRRRSVFSPG